MEPVFRDRIEALTGKDGKIEPREDVNYPTAWLLCPLLTQRLQSSHFLDVLINGLLSRAKGTLESSLVARMMLIINTSALHTTTIVLTTALYELAQRPEVCEMLREEFLRNVGSSDGYDNAAAITTNLPMLDSFLKEVMRMSPPGYCKLSPPTTSISWLFAHDFTPTATSFREVLKDFTFSSGLHVPVGATVAVPTYATYRDAQLYPDPDTFNPLRFYRKPGEARGGLGFTDTSVSDYVFSHGVHIWYGFPTALFIYTTKN